MSLARTDARFLLPELAGSAAVLGELDGWAPALASAGIEFGAGSADLVVAPAALWREAASSGARGIVLEGADRRAHLRRAGVSSRAYLPVPSVADPAVMLPLGSLHVTTYALTRLAAPRSTRKAVRNRLLGHALGSGTRLPGLDVVTVGAGSDPVPRLVEEAGRELGLEAAVDWLLVPGRGDLLVRGTLQLFEEHASEPRWVLKFARVRDYTDPFDRDEEGLALAAGGGPRVRRHSPRLVARFAVDGFQASIETAALGQSLAAFLHGRGSRPRKLAMLDSIAEWVVEVGTATAAPATALVPELERLARDVVPSWGPAAEDADPEVGLPGVPATLQHNDLGSWNIVVDGDGFTALDWESARLHGAPLWDLLYLLMDALAHLDGTPTTLADRERHFAQLFRGELDSSRFMFRWLGEAAARLELRPDVVPLLASLCWMHHGLSPAARRAAMDRHDDRAVPSFWLQLVERLARRWLTDPGLGRIWPAWHAR